MTRKLGAIGEIDLRLMATIRLELVSDSYSDLVDLGVLENPSASEGDNEDTEDCESRWKCCLLPCMTPAHSSVSGISCVALADRGWLNFLWPEMIGLPKPSSRGLGADFGVDAAADERFEIRCLVFSNNPELEGGESARGLGDLVGIFGGTGGGESRPGDGTAGRDADGLLGDRARLSLELGIVEPVSPQGPRMALARQLELTLEMLATASELLSFSA